MKRLALCLLALLTGCTASDDANVAPPEKQISQLLEAGVVLSPTGVAMLTDYLTPTPDVRAMTAAEADVNADNLPDLLLIHTSREEKGKMTLVVLLQQPGNGWKATNALPAPVENQQITLRDIDEKPPLEFVVMGSKGIRSGFAIYRIVNGELVDLFGDGMDDCC